MLPDLFEAVPFLPFFRNVLPNPVPKGHDGERGVEPPVCHMETGIRHEHVGCVMHAPESVGHGSVGIVPHPARPCLMLSAAQTGAGKMPPCPERPGFLQYRLGVARKEFAAFGVPGVPVAGEADDGNSPGIPDRRVHLHAGIEEGHFLYRSDHLDVPPEVLPLEFLVFFTPHG